MINEKRAIYQNASLFHMNFNYFLVYNKDSFFQAFLPQYSTPNKYQYNELIEVFQNHLALNVSCFTHKFMII